MTFANQLSNRNLLSPVGFKFNLSKYPKVNFFSNKTSIPGISLGVAIQPNPFRDIPIPGDKLDYNDLNLEFLVDEGMENYLAIYDWLIALGYPENVDQFNALRRNDRFNPSEDAKDVYNQYSDGTIEVLNSNYNPVLIIKFKDLFPVSLNTLEFDATKRDYTYFTGMVSFKYTIFEIQSLDGKIL
jgi:hypothetical protein